jgi:tRNA modification GTPase
MGSRNESGIQMVSDTIVAISTAVGRAALGIVRLSGPDAWKIAVKHFSSLSKPLPKRVYYATFWEDKESKESLDDVVATFYKAPHSYTGEDMVEISFHGNPLILSKAVRILIEDGARAAQGGEFTRRAFLNGKMDLIAAEAVEKIIDSTSEVGVKISRNALNGRLSQVIERERKKLMEISANIEVHLDYPDEFEEEYKPDLSNTIKDLKEFLSTYDPAQTAIEGVKVALLGAPNVGKSSILNALVGEEKAIVTSRAGTTRDTIEANIFINGLKVVLIDTAGIREAVDEVEKIGVERAKKAAENAHIKVHIVDATSEEVPNLPADIIVVNKSDLAQKKLKNALNVSAKTGHGIEDLRKAIAKLATSVTQKMDSAQAVLIAERQYDLVRKCVEELEEAQKAINEGLPIDMVEINVRRAIELLDTLVGKRYSQDILDVVFSKFCVGK